MAGEITKPLSNIIVDGTNHLVKNGSLEGFGEVAKDDIIKGSVDNVVNLAFDKIVGKVTGKKFVPVDKMSTNQILFTPADGIVKKGSGTIRITPEIIKGTLYNNAFDKEINKIPYDIAGKVITKKANDLINKEFNLDKSPIKIKMSSESIGDTFKESLKDTSKEFIKNKGEELLNGWLNNTAKTIFTPNSIYSGTNSSVGSFV